jgi:hypothetical protein
MIRSVLTILETKHALLDDAPRITIHDRHILKDIIDILTPFEEATDFVQVHCVPSAGYVLPCIKGLKHHLNMCSSRYNSSLVLALKNSLERRMPYYETNESYILAAMLDPRFKLKWCKSQADRIKYKLMLKEEAKKYDPSLPTQPTPDDTTTLECPAKRSKTLFTFMGKEETFTESENTNAKTIDSYLAAPCCQWTLIRQLTGRTVKLNTIHSLTWRWTF